ncbi:Fe(3+)-siderophore ABC transporter permease [Mycetocola tolaasinivorans]|uniref:Fe(3+)-siderophore ABC transporter permease n=1 Tax=Mycetocola tolaasinivorans TaxID=76635 RepID=A0A3L7AE83_9MICO|nr:Fe(3+)-siderophore ABC transporter permease [Mycetocola tolaasinivorans]
MPRPRRTTGLRRASGLLLALALLAVAVLLSLGVGAQGIDPLTVLRALWENDGSDAHAIVRDSRLPRTLVGLVVGPALGVCGALIQAYTRNPLADPGILGVNAGATFAVTMGVGFLGLSAPSAYVWLSFGGALIVTGAVTLIGLRGPGRQMPERMTLTGVAVAAVLSGVGSIIVMKNLELFNRVRFWGLGSLGGRDPEALATIAPLIAIGLILALGLAGSLNVLALGDDLGSTLGARILRTRLLSVLAVTILAGAATAIAGPIAFLGLMVPHTVRWFTGPDQRWIIPGSMILAPALLLGADVLGRIILPSGELQVSLMTALVGAPVLMLLARRRRASGL